MRSFANSRKGVALLGVLLVVSLLLVVTAAAVNYTYYGGRATYTSEAYDRSVAAATYGAELANAQLDSGLVSEADDTNKLGGDWVYGKEGENLFMADGKPAADQRRIHGYYNDHEFRVRIRSARLAHENETVNPTWLSNPGEFSFDDDKAYLFSDVYEITSTARPLSAIELRDSPFHPDSHSVVQTVVQYQYFSPMRYVDDTGTSFFERPDYFQPKGYQPGSSGSDGGGDGGSNNGIGGSTGNTGTGGTGTGNNGGGSNTGGGGNSGGGGSTGTGGNTGGGGGTGTGGNNGFGEYNITISGEDHYLIKQVLETVVTNKLVEPMKILATESKYFDATGAYWANGCLTLNYQRDPDNPNPYRPLTPTFGSSAEHRAMKALDPTRDLDTYLWGGKQGRTVRVEDGRILETSRSQAKEGGEYYIILGAFEDVMNLYINMAGITASNTYPDDEAFRNTDMWFRQYIGQYSEKPHDAWIQNRSMPVLKGSRIRPQTIHMIINENDEVLVREHKLNNSLTPHSSGTWTGNYMWQDVLPRKNPLSNRTEFMDPKNLDGWSVVPRLFMWEELIGYELERNPDGTFALRDDGTKRTQFKVDGNGERTVVGFDEEYQKKAADDANLLSKPRNDVIRVRQKDGTYKEYRSLNDFVFKKDFGLDQSGNRVVLDTLGVLIAYEDQPEERADYNYLDMLFTIYVAPDSVYNTRNFADTSIDSTNWWEREKSDGLTGNESHYAIATGPDPLTDGSLKANYDKLGHDPKEEMGSHIYTMYSENGENRTTFPRAEFGMNDEGHSTGQMDDDVESPYKDESGKNVFYISESDILEFAQNDMQKWINPETGLERDKIIEELNRLNPNATFVDIESRWEMPGVQTGTLTSTHPSSYKVTGPEVTVRKMAAEVIGSQVQDVPLMYARDFTALTNHELGIDSTEPYPPPQVMSLGFLGGEIRQEPGRTSSLAEAGHVPVRILSGTQPDGTPTAIREYLTETAEEAVALCYEEYYQGDTAHIAEAILRDYGETDRRYSIGFHRGGTDERLAAKNLRDHFETVVVGIKGFNPYRETVYGADGRAVAYELVIPMEEAADGSGLVPNPPDKVTMDDVFSVRFKYADDDDLPPDFVFDKPIDGAGTMIVNGNLIIKDDFSYHGILIVLGDVRVIPTLKEDAMQYGTDGMPCDEYGHSLFVDTDGLWKYEWTNPKNPVEKKVSQFVIDDASGKDLLDNSQNRVAVQPLRQSEYRGSLTVQGCMMVKGRLTNDVIPDAIVNDGVSKVAGKITLLWSSKAVDEVMGLWKDDRTMRKRLSWQHDDSIDVLSIWADQLDGNEDEEY